MPHKVITSVATPGTASIQAVPVLKPARRLAATWPPPAPAAAWAATGWVLGEVTARCLPIGADSGRSGATTLCNPTGSRTKRSGVGRRAGTQAPRMARIDSRSDPMVASTADGS